MHTTRPKLEVVSHIGTVIEMWSRNQITLIVQDDNGIHNRSDHSTLKYGLKCLGAHVLKTVN